MNDFTIIIQGRIESEQLNLWIKNYKDWNVIVSTWIDTPLDYDFPPNWKVIKSEYPERYGNYQNLDYQITSTLNGLNEVKTEYSIKVRGDEYYSNMNLFCDKILENKDKIICSSFLFRELDIYPFHISDHILVGTNENLKLMFNGARTNLLRDFRINNTPESLLGFAYVQQKENLKDEHLHTILTNSTKPYLERWFDIIDINNLKPYIVTQKSKKNGREWYRDDFDHKSNRSITNFN